MTEAEQVGAVRVGSARVGSVRMGSARVGLVGLVRVGLVQCARIRRPVQWFAVACWLVAGCATAPAFAWGPEGHGVIGVLAVERLSPQTRLQLEGISGPLDEQTIFEACNWPDKVRNTGKWKWSSPLHYVNIPQGERQYSQSRDCPNGQCATEALKKYAIVLAQEQTHPQVRQQAFNWVCHLTGDLHQPLHAGYASDRGGNDFEIRFGQETMNLHAYWDYALINSYIENRKELLKLIRKLPHQQTKADWTFAMVDEWTNQSHQMVEDALYPANPVIDSDYQQSSWEITQRQLDIAASRLASIIESVLSPDSMTR